MRAGLLVILLGSSAHAADYHRVLSHPLKCIEGTVTHPMGFQLRPGCREVIRGAFGEHEITFNQLGLRDRDYPPTKRKGATRILVLGDSNLVSDQLPPEQQITRLLERDLTAAGVRAEVINGGTSGYNGIQLALQAPRYIAAYRPDIVVFLPNSSKTFFADAIGHRYLRRDEQGRPFSYYRNPADRLPAWLRDFVMAKKERLGWAVTLFEAWDSVRVSRRALADPSWYLGHTLEAAEDIRRAAEGSGARFLLALPHYPVENNANSRALVKDWLLQPVHRYLVPRVRIPVPDVKAAALARGLPWAVVRFPEKDKKYQDPSGLHLSLEGNSVVALALRRALEEKFAELRAKPPRRTLHR